MGNSKITSHIGLRLPVDYVDELMKEVKEKDTTKTNIISLRLDYYDKLVLIAEKNNMQPNDLIKSLNGNLNNTVKSEYEEEINRLREKLAIFKLNHQKIQEDKILLDKSCEEYIGVIEIMDSSFNELSGVVKDKDEKIKQLEERLQTITSISKSKVESMKKDNSSMAILVADQAEIKNKLLVLQDRNQELDNEIKRVKKESKFTVGSKYEIRRSSNLFLLNSIKLVEGKSRYYFSNIETGRNRTIKHNEVEKVKVHI